MKTRTLVHQMFQVVPAHNNSDSYWLLQVTPTYTKWRIFCQQIFYFCPPTILSHNPQAQYSTREYLSDSEASLIFSSLSLHHCSVTLFDSTVINTQADLSMSFSMLTIVLKESSFCLMNCAS